MVGNVCPLLHWKRADQSDHSILAPGGLRLFRSNGETVGETVGEGGRARGNKRDMKK